jgi:hypothetical protein
LTEIAPLAVFAEAIAATSTHASNSKLRKIRT